MFSGISSLVRKRNAWWERTDNRPFILRRAGGISIAVVASLALGFSTPLFADELDDRKAALESEIAKVEQSIEYLDKDITETIAQLRVYQGQLPGAQQALADAQGRVEAAAAEVSALAMRVELAEETKNKITDQLARNEAEMESTREVIGQIATQAYKNGGVPADLSLMLGADGAENLTNSMDMIDQALRTQNAAMDRMAQQNATTANSQARLVAVEAEIKDLKAKADAALAAEQEARDQAAAEKRKVDKLVADTSVLSDKLKAQKPIIEARLASVEKAHAAVIEDIAERQRRLIEEARKREEARLRAEAAERARIENERRAAEAAAANRPAPPPVAPSPVAPPAPGNVSAFGLRHPVNAPLSSGFGWRDTPVGTIDYNGTGGYNHTGLDYAANCGTPLYAPAAGEVWYADSNVLQGAGTRIVLNHGVIQGNALATNYYHLQSLAVGPGQRVSAGQLIGYTGNSGNSTGCHLHFETVLNGVPVNPLSLM